MRILRSLAAVATDDITSLIVLPERFGKATLDVPYEIFAVDARAGLTVSQQIEILNLADIAARDGYRVILGYLIGMQEPRKLDYVVFLIGKKSNYVPHPRVMEAVSSGFLKRWSPEEFTKALHELFGIQTQELFLLKSV